MKVKYRYINIVKEFGVVLYRSTAGKEYNHLFLDILLEERVQEEESTIGRADDIALSQRRYRTRILCLVDVDENRSGAK